MFTDAYRGRTVTLLRPFKAALPSRRNPQVQRQAFDLYFEMRQGDTGPSQNAFQQAWRNAGYGLSTDDIRALYKDIHTKVTGTNP
jgi:hypothetical protein